jgi:hypothetical protein
MGRHMADFSEDDQRRLIDQGLENLSLAGAGRIVALRAGNAGANLATLRAARHSGIAIDSSYFAPHLNGVCLLPPEPEIPHPIRLEGIVEVPISWFRDGMGRIRPAQLCACSIGELDHLFSEAWSQGWRVITVLMQSFELIRRRSPERTQSVRRLHDYRLNRLCRLMEANDGKFVSTTFRELDLDEISADIAPFCVRSSLGQTVRRYCEQAAGRLW